MLRFSLPIPRIDGDDDVLDMDESYSFTESSPVADAGRDTLRQLMAICGWGLPANPCAAAASASADAQTAVEILEMLFLFARDAHPPAPAAPLRVLSSCRAPALAYCRARGIAADCVETTGSFYSAEDRAAVSAGAPFRVAIIAATTAPPRALPNSRDMQAYMRGRQRSQCFLSACAAAAALPALERGGTLVLKIADVFSEPCWFAFLSRLGACFAKASLAKPLSASPFDAQMYFVGENFAPVAAETERHVAWARDLPARCFAQCPRSMSPADPPPRCRRGVKFPPWARGLAGAHRAVSGAAAARLAGGGAWCSPAEEDLWGKIMAAPLLALAETEK
jgi:hypothetical protein